MKSLLATLLATAAGATFAAAPTAALNHDPATYRNVSEKATTEYKAATAKCDAKSGNDKDVCMAEAKASRARTESDAIAKYNNSEKGRVAARNKVAEAEYDVAKAKCDALSGADKDSCMDNAKSVRTAAVADAKAGRDGVSTAVGASGSAGLVASTDTKDPVKASAVAKCEQTAGGSKTGCLVDSKGNVTTMAGRAENATERAADNTKAAASTAADKTRAAAATVAEKTKEVAATVVDKTKAMASTVAQKTENATANARENTKDAAATTAAKTDNATDRAADKTRDAGRTTAVAASDTALTTKVKASLLAQPELKSLGIHVETEKGVVMLSGFVESKAEADKAVKAAKEVDGVANVKSAIKVK